MKVGDYVRTKNGIEKIKFIEENFMDRGVTFYATNNNEWRGSYNGKYYGFTNRNRTIIKSSPNIIDLIEVGDYVNGYRVVWKDINAKEIEINAYCKDERLIKNINQIKSIVTKEQFESMEYKVEG